MLSLVGYIVMPLLLALLITIIIIVIFVGVMRSLYPRYPSVSNISFLLGVSVLTIIVFVQSFLFCGGCYIKKYLNTVEESLNAIVSVEDIKSISLEKPEAVRTMLIDEYPLLEKYISGMEFPEIQTGLTDFVSYIRSLINNYLWRRVGWLLGALIVIGGFLFYRADKDQKHAIYIRNRMMEL